MRYLGLDLGTKSLGIAVTDKTNTLVTPKQVIKFASEDYEYAKEEVLKLVKEYGGKLTAKWVYGMVIYNGKEAKEYSWSKSNFYFVDTPCEKRNPGYPLDSMSIMPECNKYFVDLTKEDRNKNDFYAKYEEKNIKGRK